MTSIEALEQQGREIKAAERRAAAGLAAHLREAVLDLPSESRLGLVFVQAAKGV